ncbi:hypothetical protein LCGC14_1456270 [marine sediment metagenome]|uniref:Uncharacterized protein n=1 Tax=marine sediment metagenome TaxID=412755 RepID=A0A0F9JH59_9ZZZZ
MTNDNEHQDDSKGGRKYFGTIPHIAGAKLDVYEHRLYSHYIEICGISKTDECYQAEKTIYTACDMSKQRFHKARKGLADKKFITFRPGKPNKKGQKGHSSLTKIIDIWAENIDFCQKRSYRGKILPVEGVNNYPLKGSDITPSNKYKNLEEKKTLSPPEQGDAVAADNADDLPNSTLCGYRDVNGKVLYCHNCYGEGICGQPTTDAAWLEQHAVDGMDRWRQHIYDRAMGELRCSIPDCDSVIGDMDTILATAFYGIGDFALEPICVGCWLKRDSDTPPALTAEEAAAMFPRTPLGRAALEAWQLLQKEQQLDKPTMQEVDDLEATVEFWERVFGMLANIVHTPIPTTHPTIQGGSMFDLLNILANLDYVKLDSKDLYWKITAIGNTALEAYRQDKTVPECFDSKQVECSAPEQTADEPYVTITADKDIAPETMEALGGMLVAVDKAVKAGKFGKKPKAARAKEKRKAKKPKRTPEQTQIDNNMFEAVKFAWKLSDGKEAAWKIQKFKKFMLGTIGNTVADKRYGAEFKLCQLKEDTEAGIYPARAREVVAFGHWWRSTYEGTSMPENGTKLLNQFQAFRAHEQWESFMRKAATTILEHIPRFTSPGIELEREQLNPVVEGDVELISAEQQAEAKQIMQDLADKFGR